MRNMEHKKPKSVSVVAIMSGHIFKHLLFASFILPITKGVTINGGQHLWDARTYYATSQLKTLKGINFQRFLECSKSLSIALQEVLVEEPQDLSTTGDYVAGLSFEVWSPFIQEFNFYNELQLDADPSIVVYHKELYKDPHYSFVRFVLLVWVAILLVVYLAHTIYYFWMGVVLGAAFMWTLPRMRPPIHNLGRKLIITSMVTMRERIRFNDREAYNEVYRHVFYRVPHFFREHSSESEPEALRNLLDDYEQYNISDEDARHPTNLSIGDLDLNDQELGALRLINEIQQRRITQAKKGAEPTGLSYVNETRKKLSKRRDKHQQRLDTDVTQELTRLKAELTDIRSDENKTTRKKKDSSEPKRTNSGTAIDKGLRRSVYVAKSVSKFRTGKIKKRHSAAVIPSKEAGPIKTKKKTEAADN